MRHRLPPLSPTISWLDDEHWWEDGDLWAGQMTQRGWAVLPGFGLGDYSAWLVATVAETRWDHERWECAASVLWDDRAKFLFPEQWPVR